MNRVEIKIESPRRFTEVAHFVDQRGFWDDIEEVRRRLMIVPGEYLVNDYGILELDRLVGAYRSNMLTLSELCIGVQDYCRDNQLLFPKIDRVLALVLEKAELLAMKYRKNRLYVQVAVAAILTNTVTDFDYKPAQIIHLNKSELKQLADELESSYSEYFNGGKEESLLAIRIDPETTKDELVDTFKNLKKYFPEYLSSSHPDTLAKAKRDRDWYFENLGGKTPKEIYSGDDNAVDYDTVNKAISRYKKFLET